MIGALLCPRPATALSASEIAAGPTTPILRAAPPTEYLATFWKRDDGLPDNSINCLLQTHDGYLWIGTEGGLARFDGAKFRTMALPQSPGGAPDRISALCEDNQGRLWIGRAEGGIVLYANGFFTRLTVRDGLLDNAISSLAVDAQNRLWVGSQLGLCRYAGPRFVEVRGPDGASLGPVSSIHAARSGSLWITTRSGIYQSKGGGIRPFQFDQSLAEARNISILGVYSDRRGDIWAYGDTFLLNLNQRARFNYFRSSDPSASRVWTLFEQRDGEMWIGTGGRGLFSFRGDKFEPAAVNSLFLHQDVRAILEDREGNLWVGAYGDGLARLKARRMWDFAGADGLPQRPVTALCLAPDQRLWIGFDGAGLYVGQGKQFERAKFGGQLDHQDFITAICSGSGGVMWIATSGGGLYAVQHDTAVHYGLGSGLADEDVTALAAQPGGGVWIGEASGHIQFLENDTFVTYGAAQGLPGNPVTALLARRDGTLAAGLAGAGVVTRNGDRFGALSPGPEEGRAVVTTLLEDMGGRLWAGTEGSGLERVADGKIISLTSADGLPDDYVGQVVEDEEGNLWCGLPEGVFELRKDAIDQWNGGPIQVLPLVYYGRERRAASAEKFGGTTALRTSDGRLWFGTAAGMIAIGPRGAQPNLLPPPVVIQSIKIDGQPAPAWPPGSVPASGVIKIPPRARSLDIDYAVLSFVAPDRVKSKFKLDHYDADWVEGPPDRHAHYGRLAPGTYEFRVIACNEDGVWNEKGAALSVVALSPLWRQWWFLAAAVTTLAGAVAAGARYTMLRRLRRRLRHSEQQSAMEKERARIARDMHDEIGSKLTRISFLSALVKAAPRNGSETEQQLEGISRASRELLATLDELVWAVNPRNDNLEQLASYLCQYASDYFQSTTTECRIDMQPELPHCPLSSETRHNLFLAFEETLNNVLKHARATVVQIRMLCSNGCFEIIVADNGRGFDPAAEAASGNGLQNIRQRLTDIGGVYGLESQPAHGATVRLALTLPNGAPQEN